MLSLARIGPRQAPLRRDQLPPNREKTCQNLLDNHQECHPDEPYLNPEIRDQQIGFVFFERFVPVAQFELTSCEDYNPQFYAASMRLSEVAALVLEKTFGRGETVAEETFATEWGIADNPGPCPVYWEIGNDGNDQIAAQTKEGFCLAIQGTNLIEAAVYLPAFYEEMKTRLPQIPEGIQFVKAEIEKPAEVEWAMAASPLVINCNVPNLANLGSPAQTFRVVAATIDRALANIYQIRA